jgi:hypothetical protein
MAKIPLQEQIEMETQFVEDITYKVKTAKDPKKKRQHQNALNWWESILDSVTKLKELTINN